MLLSASFIDSAVVAVASSSPVNPLRGKPFCITVDIKLNEIPNCEMILVGSGYFGNSRDLIDEKNNRRFSIQITAKVGDLVESEY